MNCLRWSRNDHSGSGERVQCGWNSWVCTSTVSHLVTNWRFLLGIQNASNQFNWRYFDGTKRIRKANVSKWSEIMRLIYFFYSFHFRLFGFTTTKKIAFNQCNVIIENNQLLYIYPADSSLVFLCSAFELQMHILHSVAHSLYNVPTNYRDGFKGKVSSMAIFGNEMQVMSCRKRINDATN